MKIWHLIIAFIAGVIAGIFGKAFYQLFGRPVLPCVECPICGGKGCVDPEKVEPTYSLADIQRKFFPNHTLNELVQRNEFETCEDYWNSIPKPKEYDTLDDTQPIHVGKDYRKARGVIPWTDDGESTDEILRRLRNDQPDTWQNEWGEEL